MRKLIVGFNDLATTHPDLAKEADGWNPETVIAGTTKKLLWKCPKNHKWEASGHSRIKGSGCPICVNRQILIGFNDLATTHPDLAKEAHGWDPRKINAGSHQKLEWKCINDHKWKAVVKNRKIGAGCPVCVNQQILIGTNDLATTHPDLAKEANGWDPRKVNAGTNKKLNWKCALGHEWSATGFDRKVGTGCPICGNKELMIGFNDLATTHPDLAKEADGWNPETVIAGSHKRLQWKCINGHKWIAMVTNRRNGTGCPTCSISGFDPNQNGYLYFLIQPIWEIFQIGITNVPEDRLNRHKRNGFQLLDLRGPMDGHTAQELETALLRYLKSQKADLSPEHVAGKFDGYSESWTIDSYKVNNLKELIDKASEAGF
jgi:hypothetical protein